jgi:hypothetical protein
MILSVNFKNLRKYSWPVLYTLPTLCRDGRKMKKRRGHCVEHLDQDQQYSTNQIKYKYKKPGSYMFPVRLRISRSRVWSISVSFQFAALQWIKKARHLVYSLNRNKNLWVLWWHLKRLTFIYSPLLTSKGRRNVICVVPGLRIFLFFSYPSCFGEEHKLRFFFV